MSEWVTSDDGTLSLRLLALSPIARGKPIVVQAELRNNTDAPLLVRPPFAYLKYWYGIEIMDQEGREIQRDNTRRVPEVVSSLTQVMPEFVPPGQALVDEVELPEGYRAGTNRPGEYTIVYTYWMQERELNRIIRAYPRQDVWLGEIRSEPITVKRSWLP